MRPDKIIFMQTFPTGEYRNQKLGMEILLDDGDSPKAAFQLAKELVNEAFIELNPIDGTWDARNGILKLNDPPPIRNLAAERTEIEIDRARTQEDLEFLYEAAEKYNLTQQYNNKLKQLQ